ncbi:flavin reductase family protein [Salinibacterium sp. NK8237]|uniref:flavin reductase family protein n=1 Tax=Salinibacterium sp. NK8237 TaxID=2792038 RepID=UPI0018CEA0DB|nr:flavin reductase family protein [Salinibacterium sp. NK8237]MBH0128895.1 flavin reductase family protein [Salinibacterium sp. NK8237]
MENSEAADGIDAFKGAFRRHAAGVAVITSLAPDGHPVGFTATSLASLAAVPPLATFNMAQVSSSWPAITVGNKVAIHMLGPRSRHLAEKMAADHELRFVGDHWHAGEKGLPLLEEATAIAIGHIVDVHPVHNNAVVVVQIDHGMLGAEDEALLYHERTYMRPVELTDDVEH